MRDLDLLTVERIERYIVFEGAVYLQHWEDTSAFGFKIRLGLESRASLDAFDKTMKRSKKRGGQRYHMILVAPEGDVAQQEGQFCGRGWAESKGAHVALHIPHLSDQLWWREQKALDQEGDPTFWELILMEIGDDEQIIDQTRRDRADPVPVGGPRSKAVAMLLQDDDFGLWLDRVSIHKRKDADLVGYRTFDERDKLVKNICGFKSKIELDNGNEGAWNLWERQFHSPFIRWAQRNG